MTAIDMKEELRPPERPSERYPLHNNQSNPPNTFLEAKQIQTTIFCIVIQCHATKRYGTTATMPKLNFNSTKNFS